MDYSIIDLLGTNKVVLIKPTGGETPVTVLRILLMRKTLHLLVLMYQWDSMPVKFLRTWALLADIEALEINEGINVAAVLTSVSEGSNEIGIVYCD